ncbi:MAG: tetratricopeptide repeat protein [Acidobacteria bacterium]|nr:tetratricopeptide repeat protein [Acidobacteriota bacterium]
MRKSPAIFTLKLLAAIAALAVAIAAAVSDPAAPIAIDSPLDGSIFPPEITAPIFEWRDNAKDAVRWRIDIAFADGSPPIHALSKGEPPRIGAIDPDCIGDTNEPPKLTPREAAAHTWTPDAPTWAAIKRHSVSAPATVTISGERGADRASIRIFTSRDPAGAPIFYRDVPLMPSEVEKGVIKPLAAAAIPLVKWRLRNLAEPASRVVMENMPVCANCHSFSADGKTMGMDLDGLNNNRGLYILAPVRPEMTVAEQDLVQWSTAQGPLKGSVRVGFMSQVSPDARYVVTTINPLQASGAGDAPSNYYVANFKDYRFLQVFYPTRGILEWYSKASGILQPLPGADDPRYVQMGAVWSPDGKYLVFARAEARDPAAPGVPLAKFANDPNELPMRYDLYRIPFHDGKGGEAEPIAGASRDGVSNSFPKVSPDGKWIVFVKSRNGLLMRPDSELYIVPAAGGEARRMSCNTPLMNSWHSFSPNGRWLVFSSKSRSPYTRMFLTHIDGNGNDSPAIPIENATAANRAVNLPEFVNIPPDGLRSIGGPALDYYKLVDRATYFQKQGRLEDAIAAWRQAIAIRPADALAQNSLGTALLMTGRRKEAGAHLQLGAELKLRAAVVAHPADGAARRNLGRLLLERGRVDEAVANLRQAVELDPASAPAHTDLGAALLRQGKLDDARAQLRRAIALDPRYAPALYNLGLVEDRAGQTADAIGQWRQALALNPDYREAHDRLADALYARGQAAEALAHWREGTRDAATLRQAAWVLATYPDPAVRDGHEAAALAARAVQLSGGTDARVWDTLAAAYAESGRFADAVLTARRALALARQQNSGALASAIEARIRIYQAATPFRDAAARDGARPR